ncbi:MAG: flavodoxin [Candidatus Heimdallarchaeaceae archaeon]
MNTYEADEKLKPKILIAYYTRTGNTEKLANQIKKLVGGDLFKIETVDEYPPSYQEVLKVSKVEIDKQYKPPIKSLVENMDQYDIVFVGTPNWYSTMAPPVATFLSMHDLTEKTVIPFATHGGGGEARCLTDITQMSSQATVLEGIAIYGSQTETANNNILMWLKKLQIFSNVLI